IVGVIQIQLCPEIDKGDSLAPKVPEQLLLPETFDGKHERAGDAFVNQLTDGARSIRTRLQAEDRHETKAAFLQNVAAFLHDLGIVRIRNVSADHANQ